MAKKRIPALGWLFIVLFCIAGVYVFVHRKEIIHSYSKDSWMRTPIAPAAPDISYETLRQWKIGRGGTGIEVLVSESATKAEVMALARSLEERYRKTGGLQVLFIFDSREAWANRDNDKYPQDKYFKHFLVAKTLDEIKWVAEGRE